MASNLFYISAFDETKSVHSTIVSSRKPSEIFGKAPTASNYTQIACSTVAKSELILYFKFDCSIIPLNAIITKVTCNSKGLISSASTSRVSTRIALLTTGTTAKGSSYTVTTTATAFTLDGGSWTRAELNDAYLRYYAVRGTDTSYNLYFRVYGSTLTVEYEVRKEQFKIKLEGTWKPVTKVYKKIDGHWVEQTDLSNVFPSDKLIYKKSF